MATRTRTKYQSDEGGIHPISLDPGSVAAAGAAPTAAIDSQIRAKVSKSNKEAGLRPRGLRLARTVGAAPNEFVRYAFAPVLTPTAYEAATVQGTVTYQGDTWTIVAKVPEDY